MLFYLVMLGFLTTLAFLMFYCISEQDGFFYFATFMLIITIFIGITCLVMSLVQ